MVTNWYSRQYLGKSFDKFLNSDMNMTDFLQLQEALQSVSVQLRELNSFIESGSRNKIGRTRISQREEKANSPMTNKQGRVL